MSGHPWRAPARRDGAAKPSDDDTKAQCHRPAMFHSASAKFGAFNLPSLEVHLKVWRVGNRTCTTMGPPSKVTDDKWGETRVRGQFRTITIITSAVAQLAAVVLCFCVTAAAATVDALYQARTIVTGEREETRIPGIAACFNDVLVKVSADPRLIGDPRVAAMSSQAASYVREYRYHDRMEGIPIHDEQG